MSMLSTLSKLEIVHVGRQLGITMGDTARASKQDLLDRILLNVTEERAEQVAINMSARSAAMPVSQLLAPQAGAPNLAQMSGAQLAEFIAPTYPDLKVIRRERADKVFGVSSPALKKIEVDIWNDPAAPRLNMKYRFEPKQLLDALVSIARQRPIWLAGPAGTGKTEFVKQLCAHLGRVMIRVQFDASLEAYHIIGGERVKAASTLWQDGLVLQGFRHPGAIILLDEVGFARPEYTSSLHAALEPDGVITVPETGEVIDRANGVTFMAADNSNGRGDPSGVYVGVREQNNAFLSRFAKTITFDYMPVEAEAGVIADVTGATLPLSLLIAQFIAVCRAKADTGLLESPPTMREAFYLAEDLTDGVESRRAFENTVVNRAPHDTHEVLQQLWAANIDASMIKSALAGETVIMKKDVALEVAPSLSNDDPF